MESPELQVHFQPIAKHVFMMFEGRSNSVLGTIIVTMMTAAIIIGLVIAIVSTDPVHQYIPDTCRKPACNNDPVLCPGYMMCAPQPHPYMNTISDAVTVIFIIDYCTRLLTVWAVDSELAGILPFGWLDKNPRGIPNQAELPVYSLPMHYMRFIICFRNLVDLAAILPYFIGLVHPEMGINNNFVRVLRLVRVLSVLNRHQKVKKMLQLIIITMERSSYALAVLLLLSLVLVIFYGSIMYALESGHYRVDDSFPTGAFVRQAYSPTDGTTVEMASPYNSIGVTMYYVITTITTVGYGDLFPTTFAGRICANIIMYTGIVGLALPIGVISANFADVYKEAFEQAQQRKESERAESRPPVQDEVNEGNSSTPNRRMVPLQINVQPSTKDGYQPASKDELFSVQGDAVSVDGGESVAVPSVPVELLKAKIQKMKNIRKRWELTMQDVEKLLS